MQKPSLAIVILNYNTKELTLRCLESVYSKKWGVDYSVWVVDNASSDNSVSAVKRNFPEANIIESKVNTGFSKGNNLALKKVYKKFKYCLLLNSDTEVLPGSIDQIIDFAEENKAEIVSCKLLNKDNSFQPNAGDLPYLLPVLMWLSNLDDMFKKIVQLPSIHINGYKYYTDGMTVGWVSGSVMLIKSSLLDKIGFFDEKIFMYGEDIDICWRARKAGAKVFWTDRAEIIHLGGGSSNQPKYNQWLGEFKGLLYLYRKHFGILKTGLLRVMILFFTFLRVLAFFILGKTSYAKTYAKILTNL